jgi:NTE family protein
MNGTVGRVFGIATILLSALAATAVAQEPPKRPRVALVLEGGGAMGLAHVGVIKVIEELGIPIDIVVGTSMGSVVGGFYAEGYDAESLEKIALSTDWGDLMDESISPRDESYRDRIDRSRYFASFEFDKNGIKAGGGALSGRKVLAYMDRLTLVTPSPISFDALPRRFRAVAADVATGEKVVIDHGSLSDAMRASMSIPGLFEPYYLEGRYLVDGGIVENLPVETARKLGADLVLAVDLRGGTDFDASSLNRTPLEALSRSLDILVNANVVRSIAQADCVISVDLKGYQAGSFQQSKEILALGEKAARNDLPELKKFLDRIGADAAFSSVPPVPEFPRIENLVVEGGREEKREAVRALYSPIVGTVPDVGKLEKPFDELEQEGTYRFVRVRRDSQSEVPTLVVSLSEKPPRGNAFRMSLSYQSTYAKTITSKRAVNPSVIFRNEKNPGTQFAVEADIFDAPGIKLSLWQPVAKEFSVEGFAQFSRDFATYLTDTSLGYQYQTISTKTGFNIDVDPIPWSEFVFGWNYTWIHEEQLPNIDYAVPIDYASLLGASFSVRRLDSPVFPMDGVYLDVKYLWSLAELGSQRPFRTLETRGNTFLSLGTPFSVALLWKAGTDFSREAGDSSSAPYYFKIDMAERRLFPGTLSTKDRIGSHTAAVGMETKFNLSRLSSSMRVPVFMLALFSTGYTLQNASDFTDLRSFLYWNAAMGAGVRLNDAFGVSLLGGVSRSSAGKIQPFIALDIGAIGY